MIRTLSLALLLALPGLLSAQPKTPDELNDDPAIEQQLMAVPPGFAVQLVAAEPTIVNPIGMNFDTQGRLWVACAPRYPQILPGQQPKDFVAVLSDFGPDGKARKTQVFADGLTVPTGLMPGDGGVYVGQGETLLHLRDTKKTSKADERRVVLTGFGTADTHHTINTFRWGPAAALYFNQGVYIHSTVETPYGPRKLFGGGIWRLRTDRLNLEVFDRSILPNNTWGHAFDAWGQSFVASAWPGALNFVLPDSPLHRDTNPALVPDLKLTQIGGERHCGLDIVGGRHLPDDWQGNLLTGDFLSHRVYRYTLADDGTRFVARQQAPLVVSKHRKFRPIDIKQGPDGAIYIADLYQSIIQHNQIDFRDPRRDHSRGRIWRIVRTDRPLVPIEDLASMPLEALLDRLKAPEPWTRTHAKRALAERDRKEAAAALAAWTAKLDGTAHDWLEALWAHQAIDVADAALLKRVLRSDDARARAAATRVLAAWHERLADAVPLLAVQAADPQPRVRLEAVLAAGDIPSAAAAQAALVALDQPRDPLLDFALRRTTLLLRPYWYPEFQAGRLTFGGRSAHLAFALQAIRASDALPALADLVRNGKVPPASQVDVLRLLAALGDAKQQTLAWDAALAENRPPAERAAILAALEDAARSRKMKLPAEKLSALFDADPLVAAAALRLAGAWKREDLRPALNAFAAGDEPRRTAAVAALVDLGGPASVTALSTLADAKQPYPVRRSALVGLAALDVQRAATMTGTLLAQPTPPGEELAPLFTAFLRQKDGAKALAAVLKTTPPTKDAAAVGARVLAGLGVPAPDLAAVLNVGPVATKRTLAPAEASRLLAMARSHGDPNRGEAIFRRPALGCLQCHALGGAGGKVGPDLSGIGTSAPLEYLLESIVLPGKIVREGFTTAHVTTLDGKAYSGVVVRETKTELVLRDPLREELVLPTADIDEKHVGGSLMPDGLDATLTDAELADLVRFLSELGKPGPFAITHVPVARSWQVLANRHWTPAVATVAGRLPVEGETTLARCYVEMVAAGKLTLALDDARDLALWVDGRETPVSANVTLDLPRGVHELRFRIVGRRGLRVALGEGSAQARFVAGR